MSEFNVGDKVRVVDVFRGNPTTWTDLEGSVGVIMNIDENGGYTIKFSDPQINEYFFAEELDYVDGQESDLSSVREA